MNWKREWKTWIKNLTDEFKLEDFIQHLLKHLNEDFPNKASTYNLLGLILRSSCLNPEDYLINIPFHDCVIKFRKKEEKIKENENIRAD